MAQKGLLVLLALCAFTAAMVPRQRRSLPDDEAAHDTGSTSSTEPNVDICDRQTPCAWSVYTRFTRIHDFNITTHCRCSPGTTCKYFDDDISISAYVYRCQPLS